jgi:hypothetical protein
MRRIETEIIIDAPAAVVWNVLSDFPEYPRWNPFVRRIDGPLRTGATLEVEIQPAGKQAMTFRPTVIAAEPNRELMWRGSLPIPGLFTGRHRFLLEKVDDRRTRFLHSEEFSGLLLPLLWRTLDGPTRRGFEEMNQRLKERAEAVVAAPPMP